MSHKSHFKIRLQICLFNNPLVKNSMGKGLKGDKNVRNLLEKLVNSINYQSNIIESNNKRSNKSKKTIIFLQKRFKNFGRVYH